jgi:hypothetical protein
MVSVPVRREQVAYAMRRGLSQRRSCTLLRVSRSALGYQAVKAVPVLARMAELGKEISTLGLPEHPHLPGPRGSHDE